MRFMTSNDDKLVLVQEEPRGPSQLIEVQVTTNGLTKVNFPDIANLRNQEDQIIIIKKIQPITDTVLTNGPISGLPVAPLTELQKISLSLYCEGWVKGELIPLLSLNNLFTEGSGIPYRQTPVKFDSWRNLDWNKSTVQFSNGTVIAGAPYCLLFDVEYVKLRKDPTTGALVEIVGPA